MVEGEKQRIMNVTLLIMVKSGDATTRLLEKESGVNKILTPNVFT